MSDNIYLPQSADFSTRAIHVGQEPERWKSMCAVPGIITASTFKQTGPAENAGFEYSRTANPTRGVLEECVASLDSARYALCFSSGLAATSCIFSLLSQGDHIIADYDMYSGTFRYIDNVSVRMGVNVTYTQLQDIEKMETAIRSKTKIVWIESPTNPMMNVLDIKKIVTALKKHPNILLVVDNTFQTSYFQRPLELGADIVMYSMSKYMNGHSDVIMGAATTNRSDVYEKLKYLQNAVGAVPAPFDCYQVNRGLKTLPIRMERHMKSSLEVAKWLENHFMVEKVLHPGLTLHPGHEISKKQCFGHSGMMSFYIKGGLEQSTKFLKSLKVFVIAESLGGYESLASLPIVMTHSSMPPELLEEIGITDGLIRLSIGLEDIQCIINDLDQALIAASNIK